MTLKKNYGISLKLYQLEKEFQKTLFKIGSDYERVINSKTKTLKWLMINLISLIILLLINKIY